MMEPEVLILPMKTLNANITSWITFKMFNGVINELSGQDASLTTSWNHLYKTLRNITWKLRRSALSCFIAASNVLMCFLEMLLFNSCVVSSSSCFRAIISHKEMKLKCKEELFLHNRVGMIWSLYALPTLEEHRWMAISGRSISSPCFLHAFTFKQKCV